ncbi:MAG: UvrD-helicase domain-containing protein [Coprobacillus sp.]|nr:UvrD-helicase domain-containing protein [Coprobacillus sp.]
MSSVNFSSSQREAIKGYPNTNILVSAGAGSGKTTVMTERIIELVSQDTPIDKFLVLTFTDAAANSMKSKIRKAIAESQDSKVRESLSKIDQSHIETFDAFALYIVKKYSYLDSIKLDKDISIIDKGIIEIKRNEILEETICDYLDSDREEGEEFFDIYTAYSYKNDDEIKKTISDIINKAHLTSNKDEYYKSCISLFNEGFIREKVRQVVSDTISGLHHYLDIVNNPNSLSSQRLVDQLNEYLHSVLYFDDGRERKTYEELADALNNIEFKRKPAKSKDDSDETAAADKALNDTISDYIKSLKPLFSFESEEEIVRDYMSHRYEAETLVNIAREVDDKLTEYKRSLNVFEFSDISLMSSAILRDNPEVASELRDSFEYIFIDEYQDTNDIQESVIDAISKNNVYMVGDIKQSIYAFRNADCEIFNEKFNLYKAGEGGKEIDMNDNYRSRKEIVEGVNTMFSVLMSPASMVSSYSPIDYKKGNHSFTYARKDYEDHSLKKDYGFSVNQFHFEKSDDPTAPSIFDYQASLIADDIISRINNEEKIYDEGEERVVKYSDFAILIQASTHFSSIQRVFNEKHIPLIIKKDEDSIDYSFKQIIKSLVKLVYFISIDEYSNDFYHAFASVYRSPIVKMENKDAHLYELFRNKELIKSDELFLKIKNISDQVNSLSLSEIMLALYRDFDFLGTIFSLASYSKNSLLFDKFLSNSLEMEKLGYTLKEFVDYYDDIDKYSVSIEIPSDSSIENAVVLSTIHKAKGLEYHICYFPFLDQAPRGNNFRSPTPKYITPTKKNGLLFPYRKQSKEYVSSFLQIKTSNDEKLDKFYEQIRLLYVSLTRAKDENIIYLKDDTKSCLFLDTAKNFGQFIQFALNHNPYDFRINEGVEPKNNSLNYSGEESSEVKPITISSINPDYELITRTHASKEMKEEVDVNALRRGSELHYVLEHLDFASPDFSKFPGLEEKDIAHIQNMLSLDIFKDVENKEVLHEFKFYDEKNGLTGVIDCMLVSPDRIDIIDFKTNNIEDEAYYNQLRAYKDYIKQTTSLSEEDIHVHLLSLAGKIDLDIKL